MAGLTPQQSFWRANWGGQQALAPAFNANQSACISHAVSRSAVLGPLHTESMAVADILSLVMYRGMQLTWQCWHAAGVTDYPYLYQLFSEKEVVAAVQGKRKAEGLDELNAHNAGDRSAPAG